MRAPACQPWNTGPSVASLEIGPPRNEPGRSQEWRARGTGKRVRWAWAWVRSPSTTDRQDEGGRMGGVMVERLVGHPKVVRAHSHP